MEAGLNQRSGRGYFTITPRQVERVACAGVLSRREDGIAHARTDERERRLADAARRMASFDQVGLELRSIRHAQQFVTIKVLLLNHAVLDRDALLERGAQAHENSTLDLRPDAVAVDHEAGIDGRDHPVDAYVAVFDGDFRNLSEIGGLGKEAGDTAATIGTERRTPAGLRCGEVQHVDHTHGIDEPSIVVRSGRDGMGGGVLQQAPPEEVGILSRKVSEFVNETLDGEDVESDFDPRATLLGSRRCRQARRTCGSVGPDRAGRRPRPVRRPVPALDHVGQ